MHMFLYLEHRAILFHLHTYHDIEVFCLSSSLLIISATDIKLRTVGILYIVARVT